MKSIKKMKSIGGLFLIVGLTNCSSEKYLKERMPNSLESNSNLTSFLENKKFSGLSECKELIQNHSCQYNANSRLKSVEFPDVGSCQYLTFDYMNSSDDVKMAIINDQEGQSVQVIFGLNADYAKGCTSTSKKLYSTADRSFEEVVKVISHPEMEYGPYMMTNKGRLMKVELGVSGSQTVKFAPLVVDIYSNEGRPVTGLMDKLINVKRSSVNSDKSDEKHDEKNDEAKIEMFFAQKNSSKSNSSSNNEKLNVYSLDIHNGLHSTVSGFIPALKKLDFCLLNDDLKKSEITEKDFLKCD